MIRVILVVLDILFLKLILKIIENFISNIKII